MIGAFGPRMMRLAAQHADAWNWCYTGSAATFEEPLEKFRAAALCAGRDPDSIDATALANVVFDSDLQTPGFQEDWKAWMSGTTEELAQQFKSYETMGTSHLMLHCHPYNDKSFDAVVAALNHYKSL